MPGRALGRGEPVRVGAQGPEGLPAYFTFRGRRYQIRSVDIRNSPKLAGGIPPGQRELMEVRTESGLRALLSRGGEHGNWRMESIITR
jgi:hypothetical protein